MKNFISEWATRLKSETPAFFKTIIMLGLALAAIGALPTSTEVVNLPFVMPPVVLTIGHYFIVIGTTMVLIAKSTCNSLGIAVADNETTAAPAKE